MAAHEKLVMHGEGQMGSERSFGIVFAVVFALFGSWPLLQETGPGLELLGISAAFGLLAWLRPAVLRPLNRLWYRIGVLLNRIVSPVVMGAIFFLMVLPFGLVRRWSGADPLRLRKPTEGSYWRRRQGNADPSGMERQF